MSFKDLPSKRIHGSGTQYLVFYPNGYGASIVNHRFSYGGDDGLWELAVTKGTKEDWEICYDTPITSDVLGFLSDEEVDETLFKIKEL
jgi:hypothetical protein